MRPAMDSQKSNLAKERTGTLNSERISDWRWAATFLASLAPTR